MRVWLDQWKAKAGKKMGRNESEHQLLTLANAPNTEFAICSVSWSKLLQVLKAPGDISVFELANYVSQLALKTTAKHDVINVVRISEESVEV